ncbi:MAG: hypothetical protein IPJ36_04605 [Simplicispira sp.]|nr:hypothetical protein [Simplicispira sp.]
MPFFEASQSAIDQLADALWLEDGLSRNTSRPIAAIRGISTVAVGTGAAAGAGRRGQSTISRRIFRRATTARAPTTANRRFTVLRRYYWRASAASPPTPPRACRRRARGCAPKTLDGRSGAPWQRPDVRAALGMRDRSMP